MSNTPHRHGASPTLAREAQGKPKFAGRAATGLDLALPQT